MPIAIRSADAIATKWQRRAGAAGADYTEGIAHPNRDQAQAAAAAAPAYAAGVQAAIADNRFATSQTPESSARWRARATTVGAPRFTQGVGTAEARTDFNRNVAPFLAALAALDLPPRFPRGDPQNVARVAAVDTRMRETAMGQ